jgi:hypothetical protein
MLISADSLLIRSMKASCPQVKGRYPQSHITGFRLAMVSIHVFVTYTSSYSYHNFIYFPLQSVKICGINMPFTNAMRMVGCFIYILLTKICIYTFNA